METDAGVSEVGLMACRTLMNEGICKSVRYFKEIGSTNTAACQELSSTAGRELSSTACQELSSTAGRGDETDTVPRLLVADAQVAGRGRLGRQWVADSGTLTFSLVIDVGDQEFDGAPSTINAGSLPMVALAVGIAIARTIEFLASPVVARIKWPNDVHVGGGKVAGVLVESVANRPDRVVIGIGLNVSTRLSAFADNLHAPARSLSDVGQYVKERYLWLPEVVRQVIAALRQLQAQPHELLEELRERCLLTGSPIRFRRGSGEAEGECVGIDEDGGLMVLVPDGLEILHSGEVWQVRGDTD
jgi:BirA family biotin operon repressor/biotin-[acetyl-CoA-carboxylase] ligase